MIRGLIILVVLNHYWPTIGVHYFHAWCPYVRPKNKKHTDANSNVGTQKTKYVYDGCVKIMTIFWLGPSGSF